MCSAFPSLCNCRTEKYPIENEYSSYLSDHGGYSNAYTSQEDTVYYFDVQNEFFEGALDLFASFFVCPLFTETATEREINVRYAALSSQLSISCYLFTHHFKLDFFF